MEPKTTAETDALPKSQEHERSPAPSDKRVSRRSVVIGAATAVGGALVAATPALSVGQGQSPAVTPDVVPLVIPPDPTKVLGLPTSAASIRSPFVTMQRGPVGLVSGSSLTPLHLFHGAITPTDMQFERHHAGVPLIDPARHRLLVHGLVDRPLMFTLEDLMRMPSVTRTHFLECSGNGRLAYRGARPDLTPQNMDGLFANAEWTGVPVSVLLNEVGAQSAATWALAEGGDACLMSRSIPMTKLRDDAMIVYAQNGELLRPAGGYPMRLLLPGWEGNTNVKWLRRLELIREPNMSKDETSKYTDPLPDNTARQFSFDIDAKSVITYPTAPATLPGKGWVQISGLAWSGRGRVIAVDISLDNGATWIEASLQNAATPRAAVRFTHMWNWDGSETRIMSRATDETGYTQPTRDVFRAGRGPGTDYHFNNIRSWIVKTDGTVIFGDVA